MPDAVAVAVVADLYCSASSSTVPNVSEFLVFAFTVREEPGMANGINEAPKVGSTMGSRGTLAAACAGALKI